MAAALEEGFRLKTGGELSMISAMKKHKRKRDNSNTPKLPKNDEDVVVAEEKKKREKEIEISEEAEEEIDLKGEVKVNSSGIMSSEAFETLPISKLSMDAIKIWGLYT